MRRLSYRASDQRGRTDGQNPVVADERLSRHGRPQALSKIDRGIEARIVEEGRLVATHDVELQVRIKLVEIMQTRNQPLRRECHPDRQLDLHFALLAYQLERIATNLVEMDADPPRVLRARGGQYQPLTDPLEERDAEMRLELVDLLADRTMRLRQLDRGLRKTFMARRCFKSLQRTEMGTPRRIENPCWREEMGNGYADDSPCTARRWSCLFTGKPGRPTSRQRVSSSTTTIDASTIVAAMPINASTNVPVVSFTQPIKYGSKNPDDTPILVINAMPAAAARSVRMRLGSCQKVVMLQKQAAEPIEIRRWGLLGSFGTVGDCYDNAAMESFWARMQVELLNTRRWATTIELAAAMADYIDNFYNVERRHSYLGNISPTEFETLWTSTYSIPQLA